MFGRLVRMRADILFSILVSIIAAFMISGIINIDRIYYRRAVALRQEPGLVGYPAGAEVARAESIAQIKENNRFTLELDGADLIPTGKYRRLSGGGKYARNQLSVWVEAVSGAAYGQFYVAALASGERIVVLLDDQAVAVGRTLMTLPTGTVERTIPTAMFGEFEQQYQLTEADWFADMAGNHWRTTEIGQKVSAHRSTIWFVSLIGTFLILRVLFRIAWTMLLKK